VDFATPPSPTANQYPAGDHPTPNPDPPENGLLTDAVQFDPSEELAIHVDELLPTATQFERFEDHFTAYPTPEEKGLFVDAVQVDPFGEVAIHTLPPELLPIATQDPFQPTPYPTPEENGLFEDAVQVDPSEEVAIQTVPPELLPTATQEVPNPTPKPLPPEKTEEVVHVIPSVLFAAETLLFEL